VPNDIGRCDGWNTEAERSQDRHLAHDFPSRFRSVELSITCPAANDDEILFSTGSFGLLVNARLFAKLLRSSSGGRGGSEPTRPISSVITTLLYILQSKV